MFYSWMASLPTVPRKTWIYQSDNQKPSIDDRQTIEWPNEKGKRTNHDLHNITQKTKDWAIRAPVKPEDELVCSGWISSFCSTCGTFENIDYKLML